MAKVTPPAPKRVALIAHDHCKRDLVDWVVAHRDALRRHRLLATGTTARVVAESAGLEVEALLSGPLGGDQQVGARIASGEVDVLVFFWDPLAAQPHDPDVRALLRLAVMWNVPTASNRATADFLVSSPFFDRPYPRTAPARARASFGPDRPLPGF